MRTQRQEPGESSKSGAAGKAKATDLLARSGLPAGPARNPQTLLGLQQSAGNAAATRALRQPAAPGASRVRRAPGPTRLAAVEEADESRLELPPYLLDLQAAGVSTAYDLTGHKLVYTSLSRTTGQSGGTVAEIRDELAGRPETFYGRGRSFAVQSPRGSFDVTVSIAPDTTDRPETFPAVPGAVEKAGDGKIKMDAQHNSSGAVSHTVSASSQYGASLSGMALAPTPAPAVWAGAAFAAGFSVGSSAESRTTKTMSEPRVLRSEGGTVEAHRKVRYHVRIERHSAATRPEPFHCTGSLTMRVPREHLVPVATTHAPSATQTLTPQTAREVRLADSMAPLAVTGTGATHAGGGGLYDTVGSVLHPSLTAPGSAGRARLYEATSTTSVLEDLPRLLSGWVAGEDLAGKGGKEQGAYRMRADILSMTPAWSLGKTQLRTHQQAQHGAANSAGKSAGVSGGVGPGVGLGAPGVGPSARAGLLPRLEVSKGRYTVADQTVNTRQGAEVRGEKVLYRSRIRITVEGTGPTSPKTRLHPEAAEAHHTIEALISMRADEAKSLGVALPDGVTAGELFSKPTAKNADGTEKTGADGNPEKVERHLPFGATGSSVALGQLNTRPLIAAVERLFAENPRLAGYLPAEFLPPQGAAARAAKVGPEEAENQRRNYRELVTVLSETNLRANKDQLLSSGIRVRLRRKSTWHAHDVQIRVGGKLGSIRYVGDTSDWLVRSSSGVSSALQSGGSSSRGASVRAFVQAQVIPGAMSLGYMGEIGAKSSRRNQAGPTTRTDSLNNGGTQASAFGSTLTFDVNVTMTTRARTAKRALTIGSPGQDSPEVEDIASSAGADEHNPLKLDGQDVRLTTSTALTMNTEQKKGLDGRRRPVRRLPAPVETAGIGDVTAGAWSPGGTAVRDWVFVETVGDGGPVRDLAFRLLAQAAGRGHVTRQDHALEADGLAPRLAIEDRFSPQAVTAALRQATASGWVVKNLRYPRRLAELTGAVGTRFALTRPVIVHDYEGEGPGTENLVLGGHQATGQRGTGRSRGTRKTAGALENGAGWRMTEGLSDSRSSSTSNTRATTLSGTVERNAHTPRKRPLTLVQCDLAVRMAAEVKVGTGTHIAAAEQTVPGAVAVWLTQEQLEAAGLRKKPKPAPDKGKGKATAEQPEAADGPERADSANAAGAAPKLLRKELPLGFGMIEDLPDFVPLLGKLRQGIGDKNLAKELLPQQQLSDPNDNVQRLLRVLDRDGATALLAGAMDGGVPVELFRGRKSPYWAVFHVERTGDGTYVEDAKDGRDMEYITSAVTQTANAQEKGAGQSVGLQVTGSGRPSVTDPGNVISTAGGTGGVGMGQSSSTKRTTVGRDQIGVKTVAEASAASVRMRVPIKARLELHSPSGTVTPVEIDNLHLVHRILEHDRRAGEKLQPVRAHRNPGQLMQRNVGDATPARLKKWRDTGAQLPMEAQVNGFRGAAELRGAIAATMAAANASKKFHKTGTAAAYAQREAVSTEWLIAALPLLVSAGAELPANHASGVEGQDLRCSLHARLRGGRVLDRGDAMTFEAVGQSALDGSRPTAIDNQQAAEHKNSLRANAGLGRLDAGPYRNEAVGTADFTGGATDTGTNASGSMPLHKSKFDSVLAQFTVEFRIVARVSHRHTQSVRSAAGSTSMRDFVLTTPVVIRLPAPAVRQMLADPGTPARLTDPYKLFAPPAEAAGAGTGTSG